MLFFLWEQASQNRQGLFAVFENIRARYLCLYLEWKSIYSCTKPKYFKSEFYLGVYKQLELFLSSLSSPLLQENERLFLLLWLS